MFKKLLRKLTNKEGDDLNKTLSQSGISAATAEEALQSYQEEMKNNNLLLDNLKKEFPDLQLNLKAKSLIEFEQLYFQIYVDKKKECSLNRTEFEKLITYFLRELFVQNKMATYEVECFQEGIYTLGILYGYGTWTNEHYAEDLKNRKSENRDYLYKYFMDFVPDELEDTV